MASGERPFRVVFLSPEWPAERSTNGIATYTAGMREALRGAGVETCVISGGVAPAARAEDVVDLDRVRSASPAAVLRRRLAARVAPHLGPIRAAARDLAGALRDLHARWPFDVFEIEESWGLGLRACALREFPTVVRLHGPWFLNGAALGAPRDRTFARRDAREKRLVASAFGVSAPARDVLERTRRHFALPLAGASVFPNPGRETDAALRWQPIGSGPPAVLFVGRFDRHKGGDLAIDAFRAIAAARADAELWFVGPDRGLAAADGRHVALEEYVADRIPEAAVRRRVHCFGPLPQAELEPMRARARVTLVPSRYEVFGMTAVEALAAGAPLVASDAGAFREMLRDGEEALLFPAGDADALARCALRVLASPELAVRLGTAGRRLWEARYAPGAVAGAALEFYREAAERHLRLRAA